MDSLMFKITQKVVKSLNNITIRLCETLQPSSLCSTASRDNWINRAFMNGWQISEISFWKSRLVNCWPQYTYTHGLLVTYEIVMKSVCWSGAHIRLLLQIWSHNLINLIFLNYNLCQISALQSRFYIGDSVMQNFCRHSTETTIQRHQVFYFK